MWKEGDSLSLGPIWYEHDESEGWAAVLPLVQVWNGTLERGELVEWVGQSVRAEVLAGLVRM
jgi:hypothetical protein